MQDSKKRPRDKEQTFGLCERRWGWDGVREQHWNMYITICEIDRQSRFRAWDRVLRAGALGWPWGMEWEESGRGVQDGEHMYTHGGFMSMYGKNHYNIVISLQFKKNKLPLSHPFFLVTHCPWTLISAHTDHWSSVRLILHTVTNYFCSHGSIPNTLLSASKI